MSEIDAAAFSEPVDHRTQVAALVEAFGEAIGADLTDVEIEWRDPA